MLLTKKKSNVKLCQVQSESLDITKEVSKLLDLRTEIQEILDLTRKITKKKEKKTNTRHQFGKFNAPSVSTNTNKKELSNPLELKILSKNSSLLIFAEVLCDIKKYLLEFDASFIIVKVNELIVINLKL